MFHANTLVIMSGETLGAVALLVAAVPVFRLIVRNERSYGNESVLEEHEIVAAPPKRPLGTKPTAFV